MSLHERKTPSERGAAALELALMAPVVALFVAGCSTLAGYIHQTFEVDSAATAAARYLMNRPDSHVSDQTLSNYLDAAFPELGFADGTSTVSVTWGAHEANTYSYKLYEGDTEVDIPTSFESDRFEVTVKSNSELPGLNLALEGATSGISSTKMGEVDRTGGAQW